MNTLNDFDVRKNLIDMEVAVLVLHGRKELVIHPELINGLVREYSNVKVGWYPESGHLAFYQQVEQTNQFLDTYYDFINPKCNI